MNIRDLQYLVAVFDLNNFSKAAERCCVSQPTLSGQLKKLEEELGVSLIERSTRQVLFTPVGEEVVDKARRVLQTIDQIRAISKQNDDPMVGDFRVGLIPTVGPYLLPIVMPELAKTYPGAKLFLYELQTQPLVAKLLKGELDAAILARLDWDYPVQELALYREPMKLAVASDDPLAGNTKPLKKSVLNGQSLLMLEDGHCLRDQALGVCFAAGADEDKRFQATSMDTLMHMVAAGSGKTLAPELASLVPVSGVDFLPFVNPKPEREIVMLVRKNSARIQALQNIASVIQAAVAPNLN